MAVAIGLGLGLGLYGLGQRFDGISYWDAALRLRNSATLYLPGLPTDPSVYRYPPWFAAAWIPLTFLP
jgi:hypothetical protein